MGSLAKRLAANLEPRYVVVGPAIFGVRRVETRDLEHVGFAALQGSGAARAADLEIANERKRRDAELRAATPEERAKVKAEADAALAALSVRRFSEMTATLDGDTAYRKRCDAYILAAVGRIGEVLPGATLYGEPLAMVAVLPVDIDPATIAVDQRTPEEVEAGAPPRYTEPVRFVEAEGEHNPAHPTDPTLWIGVLSALERQLLGEAAQAVQQQEATARIRTFRGAGAPAADAADRQDGAEVRGAADGDPGPVAGRPGVRGAGGGRGKGGRRGRGARGEAGLPGGARDRVT